MTTHESKWELLCKYTEATRLEKKVPGVVVGVFHDGSIGWLRFGRIHKRVDQGNG